MRGFRTDSILGKCTFCGFRIKEDEKSTSAKFAKVSYGRWICGGCLFGMRDAVDAVVKQRDNELNDIETEGLKFNPETGKYES